jgi:uncharacterized membrane protein
MHSFYGWRVVGAAFALAVFGWGIGFYGPPVFLPVMETRGWPLAMVSTAVTVHFLVGAVVGANLPMLHRRLGVATATKAGALCLAIGVFGWAAAVAPWQLFLATLLSGAGWSAMSAAAVNAIVSPWFVRRRPAALAMAYNGGSIGGVIFAPLWVAAIGLLGFPVAAAMIGAAAVLTMWILADLLLSRTHGRKRPAIDIDHGITGHSVAARFPTPVPGGNGKAARSPGLGKRAYGLPWPPWRACRGPQGGETAWARCWRESPRGGKSPSKGKKTGDGGGNSPREVSTAPGSNCGNFSTIAPPASPAPAARVSSPFFNSRKFSGILPPRPRRSPISFLMAARVPASAPQPWPTPVDGATLLKEISLGRRPR